MQDEAMDKATWLFLMATGVSEVIVEVVRITAEEASAPTFPEEVLPEAEIGRLAKRFVTLEPLF